MKATVPDLVEFGPFRLFLRERRLYCGAKKVPIGSRAMAMLEALATNKGELVARNELFRAVWPGIFVHDSNLKVTVAALRRSLREYCPDQDFIRTVSGRGYWLDDVADIKQGVPHARHVVIRRTQLPELGVIVGREDEIAEVKELITENRLVTLAGAGGLGKTTVAIAAAQLYQDETQAHIEFVDLSGVSSDEFVISSVASALGVNSASADRPFNISVVLDRRPTLLVLDTCEHVLSAVAHLCDIILANAPGVRILATSRQTIRTRAEVVMWLPPLTVPPIGVTRTISQILPYSATRLLLQLCAENNGIERDDSEATALAEICRQLDGSALALRLISPALSLRRAEGVQEELGERLNTSVHKTAVGPERQHTLMATLDWSYALLTSSEAAVLRAVSIFSSDFDADSALRVVEHRNLDPASVLDALSGLRAKSMISLEGLDGRIRYRLHNMTRVFALSLLSASDEAEEVCRDHARLTLDILSQAAAVTASLSARQWNNMYAGRVQDLRAALDWALVRGKDPSLGVRLVTVGLPLWYELSLNEEAREACEHALKVFEGLDDADPQVELELLVGLAENNRVTDAASATVTFTRARSLARQLKNSDAECRVLAAHARYQFTPGRENVDLDTLAELRQIATKANNRLGLWEYERLCSDWEILTLQYRRSLERLHRLKSELDRNATRPRSRHDLDLMTRTETNMGVLYWFSSYQPGEGLKHAIHAASHSLDAQHDWTYIYCQIDGLQFILIECGEYDLARTHAANLKEAIYAHGIAGWLPIADCCIQSIEALAAGRDNSETLLAVFEELKKVPARHIYYCILIKAFLSLDRHDCARTVLDHVFRVGPQRVVLSELLRYRAAVEEAEGSDEAAFEALRSSLDVASENTAIAWQLRSATDLARWLQKHGRNDEARSVLSPIVSAFVDGSDMPDLVKARLLMLELDGTGTDVLNRVEHGPRSREAETFQANHTSKAPMVGTRPHRARRG